MKIAHRIGQAILVLFISFSAAYLLLALLPGDAVTARFESPDLGLSPEEIEQIRSSYGLDQPLIVQYFKALGGFLTGNFGYSVSSGAAVSTLIASALPSTLLLAVSALIAASILALFIAVLVSLAPDPWVRAIARALPPVFVSLPAFLIGIFLIQLASFKFKLVPVIGASPTQELILPTLTLAIPIAAPLAQVLIRSVDEVYSKPFITVVRARGASEAWIFWRNVLRNALLPAITMGGLLFGELIGGAVVTEAVFARTGIGSLTVTSVANRDTPVLLAIVVITVTAYVLINLIIDLLYPLLDPRLRSKK